MTTENWDPDVTRWNLHLLDVCTLSNDISHSTVTGYDPDFSKVEFVREGYVEPCNVENDEVLAHAYQEELSRLASAEVSGRHNFEDDHLPASILAQDWLGSSKRHGSSKFEIWLIRFLFIVHFLPISFVLILTRMLMMRRT